MFSSIKKITSLILIGALVFLLVFSVPQKVKADPVVLSTIGLAGAVVAILGAFGVTMSLDSGSATTNEEFIAALDQILPFNQNLQSWREGMQITDTGKIFVRNDILHDILSSFYEKNKDNFTSHVLEDSVFGGASYRWNADIMQGSISNLPTDQIFHVGDIISSVDTIPNFADTVESFLIDSGWFTNTPPASFSEVLSNIRSIDNGDNIITFYFSQARFRISYFPKSSISGLYVDRVDVTSNNGGTYYYYHLNRSGTVYYMDIWQGGGTTPWTVTDSYPLYSGGVVVGNYPANGTVIGSIASGSVSSSTLGSLTVKDLKDLATEGGIWDKINRSTGLNLAPDQTQPDTVILNPDSDTPIDYGYDQTGTIINSGTIPVEGDIDTWAEDIIDRTLGRDLADTDTPDVVIGELGTVGTIEGEVLSDTTIEFDNTGEVISENEITDVISISNQYSVLDGLTVLFPFCVPWDLKAIFELLLAPAEAPKLDWSFDFSAIGINESIDVDIDLSRFNTIALIFRVMIFIGFLIFLTLKTRDLIRG